MSVAPPCIKGIAIRSLLVDVNASLVQGRITDAQASRYLTAEDRAYLRDGVLDSSWCPIGSFQRLSEMLRDLEGGGNNDFVRKRGVLLAQRLISLGIHQQVTFVKSAGRSDTREQAVYAFRLAASLWNTFFNFGDWSFFEDKENEERFGLEVRNARAMPEIGWFGVTGFIERLSEENTHLPVSLVKEVGRDGTIRLLYARANFG